MKKRTRYVAIHCNCSIEIRPLRDDEKAVKIKLRCDKCNSFVALSHYENVLTPGYSDYEGEHLYEGRVE